MKMNRAYGLLEIKEMDDDQRIITGLATTISADRVGDIVNPKGAKFSLPLPLLWQHDSSQPIGHVIEAKVSKNEILIKAQIAKGVSESIDHAWSLIKSGLVRGLSIGFRGLDTEQIPNSWGVIFNAWEWLELSAVTIPANAEATIQTIKSIEAPLLAATGLAIEHQKRTSPSALGKKPTTKVKETKSMAKKTIAEQIAEFDASRKTKAARMVEIMTGAGERGESLDESERDEYDELKQDVKSIDEHLVRLKEIESLNLAGATEVNGNDDDEGRASRSSHVQKAAEGSPVARPVARVQALQRKLDPGIGFTRFVIANARAKGNIMQAYEIAKANEQWSKESPEVVEALKAAVTAGSTTDTTWASPLVNYQILTSEFIEYLRPLTILGRIPGLTRVPFKVKIGRQTGGATVNWVGEGAPKPISALAFDSVTLDMAKIAGIIVLNEELIRLSSPSAEMLVRDDLASAIVQFMDRCFVDPSYAGISNVAPASITYGVSGQVASGTTGAALRADMKTLLGGYLTANLQVSGVVLLMSQRLALAISLMTNSLGQPEFPNLTMNGGTLMGLPVITSENIPSTGGSPSDGDPIIVLSAKDILLADDGQVTIDASREASLQMDSDPDSPATASTVMVSLWQQNQVAIRAERYVNWAKRRSTAVAYISNAKYFE